MTIELKIPEVGESITEVQISEWLKAEGDEIKTDEPLAVVDSEKTTFELPSPKSGRLAKILRPAGATVKVGEVVAEIESDDAASGRKTAEVKAEFSAGKTSDSGAAGKPAAGRKSEKKEMKEEETPARPQPMAVKAAPVVEASKRGESDETPHLAPEREKATGKEKTPAAKRPSVAKPAEDQEEEIVPMTMLRRTVARRLVEAQQEMAMLTTFNEVDMSAAQALRHEHGEAFEKRYQVRLGLMSRWKNRNGI